MRAVFFSDSEIAAAIRHNTEAIVEAMRVGDEIDVDEVRRRADRVNELIDHLREVARERHEDEQIKF